MKNILKKITAIAAAAIISTASITASASDFSDVPSDAWYKSAIDFVTENNYFHGITDTEFAPHGNMTRAMFVTVMGRVAGADVSGYSKSEFNDVGQDLWYTDYVGWAVEQGLTQGYHDGGFHPDDPMSIQQLCVFLDRYANIAGIQLNSNNVAEFADEGNVADWAKASVDKMHNAGVFVGDASHNLYPEYEAARADVAVALHTLLLLPTSGGTSSTSKVDSILNNMTLTEKVYQMFIVRPEMLTGVESVTQAGEITKNALGQYPVGGIIYSANNLVTVDQTKSMILNTKGYSEINPFISVDEEGGEVARVAQKLGTTKFEPMYHYKDRGADTANYIYTTIANDIKQFGFNLDFAPDADVWTNPDNKVIGTRAFSDNADQAGVMVAAAVKGLQDNGVAASIKHFPGHGNTEGDSHTSKVYTNKTLAELQSCEFIPFEKGIAAGADFCMVGHIIASNVDSMPATLSHDLVTNILKKQLGFDGIVITDSMEMKSIAAYYTAADAAVKAVEAGCDVILEPDTLTEAANAIITAVNNGQISQETINNSVRKILECKQKYGII